MKHVRKMYCRNWDLKWPEPITQDFAHGRQLGILMPMLTPEVLAASVGIKSASKPGGPTDVVMYDPIRAASYASRNTGNALTVAAIRYDIF